MAKKITPKMAIALLKITIALCFSWPPPKTASRFQVIRFKTLRILLIINATVLIAPVVYTLSYNDYDLARLTKLWCMLAAYLQVSVEVSLFAMQHDRLQDLTSEMEHNFECAKAHEKVIYQRYIDKCMLFYAGSTLSVFLTAVATAIVVPVMTVDQPFPTDAYYPFDVEYEPLRSIIFVHQFIAVWQCFCAVCLGTFIAVLIWFTAARFEILSQQFRAVKDVREVIACVRQHTKLLRYAQDVIVATRSVTLVILIICTWAILASGLTIVSQSTMADKAQFMILMIAALMEVYACAWPADYLMDASADVAHAIYNSSWYDQSITYQRNIRFLLLRSQIPVAVSVSSFLPPLSLNYYASYVSTAFSYLMTLRVVLVDEEAAKS